MEQARIQAALEAAFLQCEIDLCPLSDRQKEILLQILLGETSGAQNQSQRIAEDIRGTPPAQNPLDVLTPQQRQALLKFVQTQEQQDVSWKAKLLNDWISNRDSGSVQFIRDTYGPQWLEQVKKVHLAEYFEQQTQDSLRLKIGDRIEVCNALWEWVQDEGPCSREWFPCIVTGVFEVSAGEDGYTNCSIRFDDGAEFEIQGVYQWNRYYWRFAQK
ncbi:MAG: hypothetical protein ACFB4I_16770 [Cyanophyceae cyanobacterium]